MTKKTNVVNPENIMSKQGFHLQEAIADAWNFCWQDNLTRRANNGDFRGNTYFLTASDIEDQVRQFAYEASEGKKRGSTGRAWGGSSAMFNKAIRISVPGSTLQAEVRDWLLSNRKIAQHNFSRGHISGMRFRPVGAPLSEAEERTLAKKAQPPKEKPVHYSVTYCAPECTKAWRSAFGRRSWGRVRTVSEWEHVTCPRCLKLRPQA